MALPTCPECGRRKKSGQSHKTYYKCKKCGIRGCVSQGPFLGPIHDESCWPSDSYCSAGGDHDRIRIDSISE